MGEDAWKVWSFWLIEPHFFLAFLVAVAVAIAFWRIF